MKTSVMDLRYRTKEILRAIDVREEVTLTHRETEKAKIIPTEAKPRAPRSLHEHPAVGMWADSTESVSELIARIRMPRSC
jgi:antitoxin (DNA-binding transcriptional repressor) of toxin-antitoxin stability system